MRRTSLLLAGLIACAAPGPSPSTSSTEPLDSSSPTETQTTPTTPSTSSTTTSSTADYRLSGPSVVTTTDAVFPVSSCDMDVTLFEPDGDPGALVVLAHGFQRNRTHVADLAAHLASWGLLVATPNLCHATAFDSDHAQNAVDLVDLADSLRDGEPVVYIGHSAGGLATWLASAADPAAIAHFGLDPVDSDQLGDAEIGTHAVPTFGLLAEPSPCNSQSNAESWYGHGGDARALRIQGADHCDFESPTDALCTAFCAGGSADDATVGQIVLSMTTAFAVWQTGIDPDGELWWTPGEPWYDLVATAAVEI